MNKNFSDKINKTPSSLITFISLGPGDPGLIPLKSCKILIESDAILIPTKSQSGDLENSRTYQILKRLEDESADTFINPFRMSGEMAPQLIPVYTPMRYRREDWELQMNTVLEAAGKFNKVCYVTMGDAGIYSTVYYLLDLIKELKPELDDKCRVIPGITSFSQASSMLKKPLCVGKTSLRIDNFSNATQQGEVTPETTVYLRPRRDTLMSKISTDGDVYTFKYLNFEGESIHSGLPVATDEYLSLTIDFH